MVKEKIEILFLEFYATQWMDKGGIIDGNNFNPFWCREMKNNR